MGSNLLDYSPLLCIFFGIGVYIIIKKMHHKKVTETLSQWANKSGYELLDFKVDHNHTGPFMFDDFDFINLGESKKIIYIINYKDRAGETRSGYILYGKSGMNLSGSNVVFEPIEAKKK